MRDYLIVTIVVDVNGANSKCSSRLLRFALQMNSDVFVGIFYMFNVQADVKHCLLDVRALCKSIKFMNHGNIVLKCLKNL